MLEALGHQGRPVVALPVDGLLRHSLRDEQAVDTDTWWATSTAALFAAGGLPAVVARPAAYLHDESQWLPPRAWATRSFADALSLVARVDFGELRDWPAPPAAAELG